MGTEKCRKGLTMNNVVHAKQVPKYLYSNITDGLPPKQKPDTLIDLGDKNEPTVIAGFDYAKRMHFNKSFDRFCNRCTPLFISDDESLAQVNADYRIVLLDARDDFVENYYFEYGLAKLRYEYAKLYPLVLAFYKQNNNEFEYYFGIPVENIKHIFSNDTQTNYNFRVVKSTCEINAKVLDNSRYVKRSINDIPMNAWRLVISSFDYLQGAGFWISGTDVFNEDKPNYVEYDHDFKLWLYVCQYLVKYGYVKISNDGHAYWHCEKLPKLDKLVQKTEIPTDILFYLKHDDEECNLAVGNFKHIFKPIQANISDIFSCLPVFCKVDVRGSDCILITPDKFTAHIKNSCLNNLYKADISVDIRLDMSDVTTNNNKTVEHLPINKTKQAQSLESIMKPRGYEQVLAQTSFDPRQHKIYYLNNDFINAYTSNKMSYFTVGHNENGV